MLTGRGIIEAYSRGDILIEPPLVHRVGANSYDVTLDDAFYVPNPLLGESDVIDLGDDASVAAMWQEYTPHHGFITIEPGETVLGRTREVIGTKYPYVAKMYARSTTARLGLSVCKCAGLGDIGYVGKWTMEITNHNLNAVKVPVGCRIAQIAFFRAEGPPGMEYDGQYQTGWMLPKALKREA